MLLPKWLEHRNSMHLPVIESRPLLLQQQYNLIVSELKRFCLILLSALGSCAVSSLLRGKKLLSSPIFLLPVPLLRIIQFFLYIILISFCTGESLSKMLLPNFIGTFISYPFLSRVCY